MHYNVTIKRTGQDTAAVCERAKVRSQSQSGSQAGVQPLVASEVQYCVDTCWS